MAKSSLQIDTTPSEESVVTFAHHLLAEIEQVAHQDKKKREDVKPAAETKVKRMEESGSGGRTAEGKGGKGERSSTPPCKFFLSDTGCKKGKSCTWAHVMDDKRRCWTCGATGHMSPGCDRPKEASKEGADRSGKAQEGKGSQRTMQKPERKRRGARRRKRL